MTLAERLAEATQKFNSLSEQRDEHLKQADECLAEMNRLQGEHRVLQELASEEESHKAKADVIEATPEPTEERN